MFWKKKEKEKEQATRDRYGSFSTESTLHPANKQEIHQMLLSQLVAPIAKVSGHSAMDSAIESNSAAIATTLGSYGGVPDSLMGWYGRQTFIGPQVNALIAQNWLINKACTVPADDAVRMGFDIKCDDPEAIEYLQKVDQKHKIHNVLKEYISHARIFGIRVAIFRVDSDDPEYYERPFNIDGVTRGSYRGISQVDPIWCQPLLEEASLSDPASQNFYNPIYYLINGKRYHRSHLSVYVPFPVTDILKPLYQFGGLSLPQMMYERVYAAERSANEAPQLLLTKRTMVLLTDMLSAEANPEKFAAALNALADNKNNYGVWAVDKEEDVRQHDTGLADADDLIWSQYQLCATIAGVPSTKLLEISPKGFNATGEAEAENYRQSLETIQAHCKPMIERHHQIALRSGGYDVPSSIDWRPLDSPTAAEWADINLKRAQAMQVFADNGAIDGAEIRTALRTDETFGIHGLEEVEWVKNEEDETEPPSI